MSSPVSLSNPNPPTILAFETSGEVCSVAILRGDSVLYEKSQPGLMHAKILMPMIDVALKTSELKVSNVDLIAVTVGPGSYTGLRIGVLTGKGLAIDSKTPIAAINTLDAMAILRPGKCCPVIDARNGDVYSAFYNNGVRQSPDRIVKLEELKKEMDIDTEIFGISDSSEYRIGAADVGRIANLLFTEKLESESSKITDSYAIDAIYLREMNYKKLQNH